MSGVKVLCRVLGSLALGTSMLIMGGLTAHAGTCLGTSGDDNLMCSSGDDYMDGFGGNDTMSGLGGYDEMHGSGGVDFLHGNNGNDTMYGEAGGTRSSVTQETTPCMTRTPTTQTTCVGWVEVTMKSGSTTGTRTILSTNSTG